jgi:hypothetical protein
MAILNPSFKGLRIKDEASFMRKMPILFLGLTAELLFLLRW